LNLNFIAGLFDYACEALSGSILVEAEAKWGDPRSQYGTFRNT
jgi:hypothetical protein